MDKKKPSIEEILAMARKQGAGGEEAKPKGEPAEESTEAPSAPSPSAETPAKPAPAKPKPASGEKPSVADVLAMARGEKKAGAPAAPKAEAKPKAAAEKPAAKPAKPAAKEAEAADATAATRGTASILEAARGEGKRGPKSKAEAGIGAATGEKSIGETEPVRAKPKAVAPPMPPKPDYARKPAPGAKAGAAVEERRGFVVMLGLMVGTSLGVGFTSLAATLAMWTLGTARFMFPNIITEPPSRFKVGLPGEFQADQVSEKFKAASGVWVVNAEYNGQRQIYALSTVCTHLGCTPNWLQAEQKFKCPCHGSGFYKDGINFEGPAPRPLERYAIRLAEDGQLEVDKSRKFQEEKGEWASPDSFVTA